jgi:hypothetical protein
MKNLRRTVSVFTLVVLATIGVSAQAQRQPYSIADRHVSVILQRLDSSTFRDSLNLALVQGHIDETRPQNDINSFEPAFESAIDQFKDRFIRRLAVGADVENVLQKASLVNGFMTRNRLNPQVQNDWASVRTDLNALANAYGVSWQWNRQTTPLVNLSRSRLSDSELNQLIRRIETDGNRFRSSLTDAFALSRYDRTTSETNMNESVRNFEKATEQLRNRFDARQSVTGDVKGLLEQATPIDRYMRAGQLTPGAQYDWSTLRTDLDTLAVAYNISVNWQNGAGTAVTIRASAPMQVVARVKEPLLRAEKLVNKVRIEREELCR